MKSNSTRRAGGVKSMDCKPSCKLFWFSLALGLLLSLQAQAAHEVILTEEEGLVCMTVTFEGGEHLQPIHLDTSGLIRGTPIRFGPEWVTLTAGPYSNNPSVPTIAIFEGNIASVLFEVPAVAVNFSYASAEPVTLEAFDSAGSLLSSASGPQNLQPNGFNLWEQLGVTVGSDWISSVLVHGTNFGTGIDDLQACFSSIELIDAEIDLHPNAYPNDTDPYNTNSRRVVDLGVLSDAEFDATTIDIATASLGDPELAGYVAARGFHTDDIDGDGLLDLVIDFGEASGFAEAGALNSDSTEVLFTAMTLEGDYVSGTDTIVIAGN